MGCGCGKNLVDMSRNSNAPNNNTIIVIENGVRKVCTMVGNTVVCATQKQ